MRYDNWDVLLFPGISKTPIQEFRTQCFVTRARESPYLLNNAFISSPFYQPQRTFGQLPVVTSYIPSLPPNSRFRVSIHSWETPRPSRTLENMMRPDDSILFEIRVFFGENCVAILSPYVPWPYVIDSSAQVDKNGQPGYLHFPPFQMDVLDQIHWDATETHGRIRVIIAEGFSRPHRSPPFERIKDIIMFSYQHAPLEILEAANIAWPNRNMWDQAAPESVKYPLGNGYCGHQGYNVLNGLGFSGCGAYNFANVGAEDTHTHSPNRPELHNGYDRQCSQPNPLVWTYRHFPMPQPQPSPGGFYGAEPRFGVNCAVDPFVSPVPLRPGNVPVMCASHITSEIFARPRSNVEDTSMPDYPVSSVPSSRVMSSVTEADYDHSQPASVFPTTDEDQGRRVFPATPDKKRPSKCKPPRVASIEALTKSSVAAQVQSGSYCIRNRAEEARRIVSGSSAQSSQVDIEPATVRRVRASPAAKVTSRKNREARAESDMSLDMSSDASRNPSRSSPVEGGIFIPEKALEKRKRVIPPGSQTSTEGIVPVKKQMRVDRNVQEHQKRDHAEGTEASEIE